MDVPFPLGIESLLDDDDDDDDENAVVPMLTLSWREASDCKAEDVVGRLCTVVLMMDVCSLLC